MRNNNQLPDNIENDTTTSNNQHGDTFNNKISFCHIFVEDVVTIFTMYLKSKYVSYVFHDVDDKHKVFP